MNCTLLYVIVFITQKRQLFYYVAKSFHFVNVLRSIPPNIFTSGKIFILLLNMKKENQIKHVILF